MVDPGLNTSPQFTLTCSSTGGPATTVTWTRDSVPVSGDMMTAFNGDTSDPQYIHTLTVTGKLGGLYTCTVANNKPSEDSAQFTVQGMHNKKWRLTLSPECVYTPPAPFPPSGVTVSQNGVDSVQVSWTPPSGEPTVTGYIIYYQQQDGGHNSSEMAGATATTATIIGLMTGATYSITMVTTSSTLPSTVSAAVTVTIGMIW